MTASGGWGVITPTCNHLWFVAYLFVYTLIIVGVGPLLKRLPRVCWPWRAACPSSCSRSWSCLPAPPSLEPMFEETHALVDDWYGHAVNFSAFVFGYAIAKHEAFFEFCERIRWPMLLAALGRGRRWSRSVMAAS